MRYTVLTYIFNGYEQVHEVGEKDPKADYVMVTDDPKLTSRTWRVVCDNSLSRLSPFDKCYQVRFHPFRYAATPIVVRVDGSFEVRKPLTRIVDEYERGDYDRCMMIHPERNTMPAEYDAWCKTRGYSIVQAAKCLTMMESMGYDLSYRGLFEAGFEVVSDTPINRDVNDLTFGLLTALGTDRKIERVDQTILSFVINRFFADSIRILPVPETIITDGNLMQWYQHNSKTKTIPVNPRTITPMMFNRECEVWKPK